MSIPPADLAAIDQYLAGHRDHLHTIVAAMRALIDARPASLERDLIEMMFNLTDDDTLTRDYVIAQYLVAVLELARRL